jgi:adenylate cyclase
VAVFEVLDYHTEATFPHLDRVFATFKQGVESYRNRAWEEALICFERALQALAGKPSI